MYMLHFIQALHYVMDKLFLAIFHVVLCLNHYVVLENVMLLFLLVKMKQ